MSSGKVLVLLPSQAFLRLEGGKMMRVGTYLSELTIPAMALTEAGYELTYCSVQGNRAIMDPGSKDKSHFKDEAQMNKALEFWEAMKQPVPLSYFANEDPEKGSVNQEAISQFDGVFIPGGHSPIIDMMSSTAIGRILVHFEANKKVISAICHGPLVLAAASHVEQDWIFKGRKMTVFTKDEEKWAQDNVFGGHKLGFYPRDVLKDLGGDVHEGGKMESNVIVDGNLVTGQNPPSAEDFAQKLIEALRAHKK